MKFLDKKVQVLFLLLYPFTLSGCISSESKFTKDNDDTKKEITLPIHIEYPKDNYDTIINCESKTPLVITVDNTKKCLLNKQGQTITKTYQDAQPNTYSPIGLTAVKLNDKWGFINNKGAEIISPKYETFIIYSDGITAVIENKKIGFINEYGKELISPRYDNFKRLLDGTTITLLNKKHGLITQDFNTIIKPKYDEIDFNAMSMSDLTRAILNGKHGVIDRAGKVVIPFKYDSITSAKYGIYLVSIDDKWGFISTDNRVIVPVKYTKDEVYTELTNKVPEDELFWKSINNK
ncbi:MAG: hypothetical protein CSA42_03410 [Gammaproteobacteria bacterium]|nr:MAG: hypothetical protein CSA42_03410 [Gammaproteobacteria bacterium]